MSNITVEQKLRRNFLLSFASLCLFVCLLPGCKNNASESEQNVDVANEPMTEFPQFSAEIRSLDQATLDSLGAKTALPTQFILPGAYFAQVVYPERLMQNEHGAEVIEYFSESSFQIPVKGALAKSALAISSKGFTLETLKAPQTDEELQQGFPTPVEVVYLEGLEALDKAQIIEEVFKGVDKTAVQSRKIGKFDVNIFETPYMVPLSQDGKMIGKIDKVYAGVCFPSDNSIVFMSGAPSAFDLYFGDKAGDERGIVAQRIARTNLDTAAVAFQYDFDFDFPNTRLVQLPVPVTQELLAVVQKTVAAFQFVFDISKQDGNLLTLTVNVKTTDGAGELRKAIGTALMQSVDNLSQALAQANAQDASVTSLVNLLKSVNLTTDGSSVVGTIKNSQESLDFITNAIKNLNDLRVNSERYARYDVVEESLFQMSRAFTAYFGKNKTYPTPICAEDGTPLLSWRVALLPMIGAQSLYDQFKLDEPWNSENNVKLLDQMPAIYASPLDPSLGNKTRYLVFNTPDTPFGRSPRGLRLQDVADPSRTMGVVFAETAHAVEWTKPENFAFNPQKPTETFGDFVCAVTLLGEVIRSECDDSEKTAKTLASLIYGVSDDQEADDASQQNDASVQPQAQQDNVSESAEMSVENQEPELVVAPEE